MWPYFVPILICLFSCLFPSRGTVIKAGRTHIIYSWHILLVLLVVFAGMRGDGSGDYWGYLTYGSEIRQFSDVFSNTIRMDYAYCVIAWIINIFHLPAQVIIVSMNTISILCIGVFIKRYSSLPKLSVLLFLPFYFQFDMHAARTACAIGILTLSIPYVIERKPLKFAVVLIISMLFHLEAFIGIFLYFLPMIEINLFSGLVLLTVDLIIALPNLTDKLSIFILQHIGIPGLYGRFMRYTEDISSNPFSYAAKIYDIRFLLFFGVFVLACILVKDKKGTEMRVFKNASFLTIFLMIFFVNHAAMVFRLSSFYSIFCLALIPDMLLRNKTILREYCIESIHHENISKQEYLLTASLCAILACMYALRLGVPYKIFELMYWQ